VRLTTLGSTGSTSSISSGADQRARGHRQRSLYVSTGSAPAGVRRWSGTAGPRPDPHAAHHVSSPYGLWPRPHPGVPARTPCGRRLRQPQRGILKFSFDGTTWTARRSGPRGTGPGPHRSCHPERRHPVRNDDGEPARRGQ
jgi:hypothetical protein